MARCAAAAAARLVLSSFLVCHVHRCNRRSKGAQTVCGARDMNLQAYALRHGGGGADAELRPGCANRARCVCNCLQATRLPAVISPGVGKAYELTMKASSRGNPTPFGFDADDVVASEPHHSFSSGEEALPFVAEGDRARRSSSCWGRCPPSSSRKAGPCDDNDYAAEGCWRDAKYYWENDYCCDRSGQAFAACCSPHKSEFELVMDLGQADTAADRDAHLWFLVVADPTRDDTTHLTLNSSFGLAAATTEVNATVDLDCTLNPPGWERDCRNPDAFKASASLDVLHVAADGAVQSDFDARIVIDGEDSTLIGGSTAAGTDLAMTAEVTVKDARRDKQYALNIAGVAKDSFEVEGESMLFAGFDLTCTGSIDRDTMTARWGSRWTDDGASNALSKYRGKDAAVTSTIDVSASGGSNFRLAVSKLIVDALDDDIGSIDAEASGMVGDTAFTVELKTEVSKAENSDHYWVEHSSTVQTVRGTAFNNYVHKVDVEASIAEEVLLDIKASETKNGQTSWDAKSLLNARDEYQSAGPRPKRVQVIQCIVFDVTGNDWGRHALNFSGEVSTGQDNSCTMWGYSRANDGWCEETEGCSKGTDCTDCGHCDEPVLSAEQPTAFSAGVDAVFDGDAFSGKVEGNVIDLLASVTSAAPSAAPTAFGSYVPNYEPQTDRFAERYRGKLDLNRNKDVLFSSELQFEVQNTKIAPAQQCLYSWPSNCSCEQMIRKTTRTVQLDRFTMILDDGSVHTLTADVVQTEKAGRQNNQHRYDSTSGTYESCQPGSFRTAGIRLPGLFTSCDNYRYNTYDWCEKVTNTDIRLSGSFETLDDRSDWTVNAVVQPPDTFATDGDIFVDVAVSVQDEAGAPRAEWSSYLSVHEQLQNDTITFEFVPFRFVDHAARGPEAYSLNMSGRVHPWDTATMRMYHQWADVWTSSDLSVHTESLDAATSPVSSGEIVKVCWVTKDSERGLVFDVNTNVIAGKAAGSDSTVIVNLEPIQVRDDSGIVGAMTAKTRWGALLGSPLSVASTLPFSNTDGMDGEFLITSRAHTWTVKCLAQGRSGSDGGGGATDDGLQLAMGLDVVKDVGPDGTGGTAVFTTVTPTSFEYRSDDESETTLTKLTLFDVLDRHQRPYRTSFAVNTSTADVAQVGVDADMVFEDKSFAIRTLTTDVSTDTPGEYDTRTQFKTAIELDANEDSFSGEGSVGWADETATATLELATGAADGAKDSKQLSFSATVAAPDWEHRNRVDEFDFNSQLTTRSGDDTTIDVKQMLQWASRDNEFQMEAKPLFQVVAGSGPDKKLYALSADLEAKDSAMVAHVDGVFESDTVALTVNGASDTAFGAQADSDASFKIFGGLTYTENDELRYETELTELSFLHRGCCLEAKSRSQSQEFSVLKVDAHSTLGESSVFTLDTESKTPDSAADWLEVLDRSTITIDASVSAYPIKWAVGDDLDRPMFALTQAPTAPSAAAPTAPSTAAPAPPGSPPGPPAPTADERSLGSGSGEGFTDVEGGSGSSDNTGVIVAVVLVVLALAVGGAFAVRHFAHRSARLMLRSTGHAILEENREAVVNEAYEPAVAAADDLSGSSSI